MDKPTYKVTVTRITKGEREESNFEKLYDSDHPKIKADPEHSQYGYVKRVKRFEDKEVLFEELVEEIDLARVIRAVNVGI